MTSHLVTGIGELVTHDPRFDGPLLDAALVARGRPSSPGSGRRRTRPPPTGAPTSPAPRSSPASSTPTRTSSSRATARPSSRPAWPARRTPAAASRRRSRRPGRRPTTSCARASRPSSPRRRAQGTTTIEIKSGYGLDVATEERLLRAGPRGHHRDHVPRRARRPARASTAPTTSRWSTGPMLAACAPHARWADVFCEPASPVAFDGDEAREVLVAARRAGSRPARARQPARAGPGRAAGRRARRRERRPLHLPERRRRRRAGRRPARSPPCCPASSSPPGPRTPTRAACSTRASRSRSPATATPARASRRRCR